MARVHGLIYTGSGFIVGVPARDLSPEEVKKYGKDWLLASGLYQEEYRSKRKAETEHEEE